MAVFNFRQIGKEQKFLGGKAWGLGMLTHFGFSVPDGLVLTALPNPNEWADILSWWHSIGHAPLAVRSSAGDEDSSEHSFAGQNKTYLNQKTPDELLRSIHLCFESIDRTASLAYREYFGKESNKKVMNVVIQRMIDPKFAGVFFSVDPRNSNSSEWILEVISGLGESLVSGQVNPGRVLESGHHENLPAGFQLEQAKAIAETGIKAREFFEFEVDMEWAIDVQNQLHLLQIRPITTLNNSGKDNIIQKERSRLHQLFDSKTTFDGQTFSEWSGLPSPFTYSIWQQVFSPLHAFGSALKMIGYQSFDQQVTEGHSLLDRILGRVYLNLSELSDLYYGPIPYSIEPKPRPHAVFDWKKLSLRTFAHFPMALLMMIRVAWNVSAKRKFWLTQCRKALIKMSQSVATPMDASAYQKLQFSELQARIKIAAEEFSKAHIEWPLVLVILTESTLQRLRMILTSVFGETAADEKIRDFMAHGLHTVTSDMERTYENALANPDQRPFFMAQYGHRGPGEMDLKNPRWHELGQKAWLNRPSLKIIEDRSAAVESEIKSYATFKREIILDEWRLLKEMLELREQWKMEILKPYAEIRLILTEIGKRTDIGNLIHWLQLEEVLALSDSNEKQPPTVWNQISMRQEEFHVYRAYSLPEIVSLEEVDAILDGKLESKDSSIGESLSSGLAKGVVRVILDPTREDLATWPDSVIIVAEATDPGWTPLFAKAKGIIVERGGVLSHCAIVAREMGIPAVSGIHGATKKLKNDESIIVDGNHGRVFT